MHEPLGAVGMFLSVLHIADAAHTKGETRMVSCTMELSECLKTIHRYTWKIEVLSTLMIVSGHPSQASKPPP